jgi:hypothetical protein
MGFMLPVIIIDVPAGGSLGDSNNDKIYFKTYAWLLFRSWRPENVLRRSNTNHQG